MRELIDIHTHILPGIDDGAKTMEDSLAMARAAVEQGIHTVFATPHHQNGYYMNKKQDIVNKVKQFRNCLQDLNIPLTILVGQETRIHADFMAELNEDIIAPLQDTSYILVEFPSFEVPRYADKLLFDIQIAGFMPIIVHPERNQQIAEHPSILYDFVKKGALTQITAASLTGRFGKKTQQLSYQLIEHHLTHFIASDAHNTSSRRFILQEAFQLVRKEFGWDVYYTFMENPQLLLENQYVHRIEPLLVKKKNSIFKIFP